MQTWAEVYMLAPLNCPSCTYLHHEAKCLDVLCTRFTCIAVPVQRAGLSVVGTGYASLCRSCSTLLMDVSQFVSARGRMN